MKPRAATAPKLLRASCLCNVIERLVEFQGLFTKNDDHFRRPMETLAHALKRSPASAVRP